MTRSFRTNPTTLHRGHWVSGIVGGAPRLNRCEHPPWIQMQAAVPSHLCGQVSRRFGPAPSAADVAGTWNGSECDPPSRSIACYLDLTISQTGSTLSGRYVTAVHLGTVTGNVVGTTVSMSMLATNPPFAAGTTWSVNVTVRGDEMAGT